MGVMVRRQRWRRVGTSAEKQQNVTKEFVDVLLSAGTNDGDAELGKLIESAMRLTVARESVLRYYPDAFEKIKEDPPVRNENEARSERKKATTATTTMTAVFRRKIKQKRISKYRRSFCTLPNASRLQRIRTRSRFAPWFFQEFCASKERKRNAAINEEDYRESAERYERGVFRNCSVVLRARRRKKKEAHIVHLLRALKTKEDVYEAYDDSNPPKVAIESFLVECFDGKKV